MWHFSKKDKKLGYNDGRTIEAGQTLTVDGEIELCKFGLHASPRLIDALNYAPGSYIWKVELSGEVIHGDDKSVASERKALWGYDATEVLRAFSRRVALDAVETRWDAEKFGEFPAVAMEFLKTGKGSPSAAYAAADSAKAAAYAAHAAANSVYTANSAHAAAYVAAYASKNKYNTWLEEMILEKASI